VVPVKHFFIGWHYTDGNCLSKSGAEKEILTTVRSGGYVESAQSKMADGIIAN
jgi:hypothetical protein